MGRGPGGLLYQVKGVMEHNRDGAGLTQDRRLSNLKDLIETIYQKYKLDDIHQLRTKHVDFYAQDLKTRTMNPHSMRVKMSDVRWLAEKIGKQNIVARDNAIYGFPEDSRKQDTDQAWPEDKYREVQGRMEDERVAFVMRGARYLGLRLEEVSKVRPQDIDWTKNVVHLKRGTKGGRYRYVMLVTPEARAWAHELGRQVPARDRGIIPPQYTERSWKSHVQREIRKAGGGRANGLRLHGLRHTFAQDLYQRLCGSLPPIKGGKPSREVHQKACKTVSKVLGHNRWRITETYVGKLSE
jgi:integrase